jgi:hypothetical protein
MTTTPTKPENPNEVNTHGSSTGSLPNGGDVHAPVLLAVTGLRRHRRMSPPEQGGTCLAVAKPRAHEMSLLGSNFF